MSGKRQEGVAVASVPPETPQPAAAPTTSLTAKPTAPQRPQKTRLTRKQRFLRFLLSLPTVVAFVYFVFLVCVAFITTTTARAKIGNVLYDTWRDAHATQITTVHSVVSNVLENMHQLAVAAAAMYSQSTSPIESNKTLTMLCAQLTMSDPQFRLRVLAMGALSKNEYASCVHGDFTDRSPSNMSALMSDKGHFYGAYYINPSDFTYYDPPILKGYLDPAKPAAESIQEFKGLFPIFAKLDAYVNGTVHAITKSELWSSPITQPNYLYYTLPLVMMDDSHFISAKVHPADFAQTRIDGDMLLNHSSLTHQTVKTRAMVLIRNSLTDANPRVLSNNWGQEVVNSTTYAVTINTNTRYLRVSRVTDPLMRAALQRVNLHTLQVASDAKTKIFTYRGAPAAVTAYIYQHPLGVSLPMVVVSAQADVTGSYLIYNNINTGVIFFLVILFTLACYFAMDRYLARPLRRLTAAMLASLRRGVRQPVRADPCDVVQLTETRELTQAYNAAMAQLRLVDEFVPKTGHNSVAGTPPNCTTATRPCGPTLQQQYLTIVTVRIRSSMEAGKDGVDTTTILQQHAHDVRRERFTAFVNAVAVANTQMTSSGPFASPAALAAFVCAVRELCAAHHGTVHRLTPDSCVLHFASAVRTCMARQQRHPPPPPDSAEGVEGEGDGATNAAVAAAAGASADVEVCATADARAAVDFALALQQWVEEQRAAAEAGEGGGEDGGAAPAGPPSAAAAAVPDVRVLVDTGVFTCGQYRADALEQTLSVALGRDAERAVGGVAAQIGVRVALTEETAVRVRGVRQIPVEALHTGRAGLDADVIILYEALPGPVAGDAAWQQYARCCFDGFAAMVNGDYAGALRCYRSVAEIAELEPGLLPRCVSREAAASSVVGGAVSTQVARLIAECEVRVGRGCTEGFARRRVVPFGVDALLPGQSLTQDPRGTLRKKKSPPIIRVPHGSSVVDGSHRYRRPFLRGVDTPAPTGVGRSLQRFVVSVHTAEGVVRRVLGGRPDWIQDNYGLFWYLPKHVPNSETTALWMNTYTVLGSAGTLCTATTHVLRDTEDDFCKTMEDAPTSFVPNNRSNPMFTSSSVTAATRAKTQRLFQMQLAECHPNILRPLAYSFAIDGCLTVMWEFCPNGTLRDVVHRYPALNSLVMQRFGLSMLSGLCHLHSKGLVHGFLSLDTVSVGADGVCRLMSRFTDFKTDHEVCVIPQTCYISPAMAAGQEPTPACDMFCYGLLCLEAVSLRPAWTWAKDFNDDPLPSDDELKALMKEGGAAFCQAVVSGRVVPNTCIFDPLRLTNRYSAIAVGMLLNLLSYDPAERPTAAEVFKRTRQLLVENGLTIGDGDGQEASESSESSIVCQD